MEQVLEHLLADRKKAEQEERKFWEKLFEDKIFKEAMYTDSFKVWFLKYLKYSRIDLNSNILQWRKSIEKVQTLNHLIDEVEEKNTQWRIVERLSGKKKAV